MLTIRSINAVDSHTMGEPTRVIVGGIPKIPGRTMAEKKEYLEHSMDQIRTAIMQEPRGHNDMFGSIITAPANDEADFGIIFMDTGGYLNMCGHGTIGAVTVAIETGMVEMVEPTTEVVLDTPAGTIKAKAHVVNKKVKEVSIINVPSFLYKRELKIFLPDYGEIAYDIAFGGSFFALINAKQLGLKLESHNINKLIDLALRIRDIINNTVDIIHPTLLHINTVDLIEFYDEPIHMQADLKNIVVFGRGQVDRSPCGTGTSAKLAALYTKGEIIEGECFTYESILGTLFKGCIIGKTQVGEYDAVIPEITGSAYITGFYQFVIDPEDPIAYGFKL